MPYWVPVSISIGSVDRTSVDLIPDSRLFMTTSRRLELGILFTWNGLLDDMRCN